MERQGFLNCFLKLILYTKIFASGFRINEKWVKKVDISSLYVKNLKPSLFIDRKYFLIYALQMAEVPDIIQNFYTYVNLRYGFIFNNALPEMGRGNLDKLLINDPYLRASKVVQYSLLIFQGPSYFIVISKRCCIKVLVFKKFIVRSYGILISEPQSHFFHNRAFGY